MHVHTWTRALRNSGIGLTHMSHLFIYISVKFDSDFPYVDPNFNFCAILFEILRDLENSVYLVYRYKLCSPNTDRNLYFYGAVQMLIGQDMIRCRQILRNAGKSNFFLRENQMILSDATIELQCHSIIALVESARKENRNPKYVKHDSPCCTPFVMFSIRHTQGVGGFMTMALRSCASFGHAISRL